MFLRCSKASQDEWGSRSLTFTVPAEGEPGTADLPRVCASVLGSYDHPMLFQLP